jgi:hypothetical protein
MSLNRFPIRIRASLLAIVLATAAAARSQAALPISLTVQEALLPGASGLARASGPVSVGVPLESNSGITNVSQLGMSGATAAQFRVLARWPNGAIRWVLVDFQSDLAAGGTAAGAALTTGSGAFGGSDLAVDNGTSILVSTGSASFTIRKSPFRVFDQVSVGATNLVSAGGEGFVVVDGAGTRYTSANDPGASVVIEENGPVRSVIRATGTLRSAAGARLCDYLIRLHFYRGKSYVRAWASMKNARGGGPPTTFLFNSAEIVVPLALGTGTRFQTSTSRGPVSDALATGETAYVFQARSSLYDWVENSYAEAPIASTQNGVEVRKVGGTVYQGLSGNVADYADGWASLEDGSGKGVTIALRWMPQFWPAGLEVGADGHASVELFSKRNAKTGIKFAWGAYETREMSFNFYATPPANRTAALYELQYPLVARAPLPQYASAGAIFGETKLASVSEQQSWFARHGASSPTLANITPSFWRFHAWPTGGGGNQTDFALIDLLDFLRTGFGGYLAQGERNTLFKADTAVRHSDGFDYTNDQVDPGDEWTGTNAGAFNWKIFDFEHSHWFSLPIAYYLTGNEIYHDAVVDYGEWKHAMADGSPPLYYNPINSFGDGSMRVWSRYNRDFALLWDVTRDARYWTDLSRMMDGLLASRDVPGSALPPGRNLDRGYMWMAHGDYILPRSVSDFMTVQLHSEGIWETIRLFREAGDPRVEALQDYFLGLADFVYNEFYLSKNGGTTPGDFGYAYSYKLDQFNDPATSGENGSSYLRPISSSRPLQFAYEMTGNTKYLDREAKLLIGDVQFVTDRTTSEYASLAYMSTDLYRAGGGWQTVPGVATQNLGGGSYQLSWTVPSGTTGYRVKYSDRNIVDWLGFDQATRTYQYSPSSYVSWFAAQSAAGEPAPLPGGSVQTMTVSGLDPSKTFRFSVRFTTTVPDFTPPASARDLSAH